MRVHYSGYFLNLLAAIDLLQESTHLPNDFKARFKSLFAFNGFPDGESNYLYIRELRNAVVHRGLNIASSAHSCDDFPMILAEPKVQNQQKTKTFFAFDKYLLQIIAKCELAVIPLMFDCLYDAGIFESTACVEATVTEYLDGIESSEAMPEWAKAMARTVEFKPEWTIATHVSAMAKLREALEPCDTSKLFAI